MIEAFYQAFQARDHAAMATAYHPDIRFSDPVFTDLRGSEVSAMWHMLCEQGTDLEVSFGDVTRQGDVGSAHWEARYTFTPTGRAVHNRVDASFIFDGGEIIRHVDSFGLWRWTRMALGGTGTFLGWSPLVQKRVRATAARGLARFIDDHPEYRR